MMDSQVQILEMPTFPEAYNREAPMIRRPEPPQPSVPTEAESTFQLLDRIHAGDTKALDVLFARYMVPLRRWAAGRLPKWARHANDTHDIVQDTLLNVFKRIETFEPRREGAFQAYLRQAVMNRIRDCIRRAQASPTTSAFQEDQHEHPASLFDDLVRFETLERYEAALARLAPADREAIIGRVELGNSYAELAKNLDKPSADAARMTVARALVRLADEMKHGH